MRLAGFRTLALAGMAVHIGFTAAAIQPAAADDGGPWTIAIGTGVQFLNAKGDLGFTSFRGAEQVALDMTPSDFQDFMTSALGVAVDARRERWRVGFEYGHLRLEDQAKIELVGAFAPLATDFQQDVAFADATVAYRFADMGRHGWDVLGGVRNLRHEYDIRIAAPARRVTRRLDKDWTDLLVGIGHDLRVSDEVEWISVARWGFGESDTYWSARTSLNWRITDAWQLGAYVDYRRIDFEHDSPGDRSWYLYDADEWGPGLSVSLILP